MATCLVKTGFFVLRQCGAKATFKCSACQRPTCPDHMIQEHKVCTECFDYARDDDVTDYRDRLIKGTGFYSYRRHYYDRHDDLDDIDDLLEDGGFEQEDADVFDAPSIEADLNDDLGFEDSADLFDS